MHSRSLAQTLALALPLVLASCAGMPGFSKKKDDGLSKVDDLLSKIEQVQAESVLSKERSAAAIESLSVMVDPDFSGDPVASYGQLSTAIKESKTQAQKLAQSIAPMKSTAAVVFDEWTASLESFGNTKMRKHSQARMEQTRARYEAVLQRAVAAQISYDALNADLHDHALFLEHDFNPESASLLAEDMDALDEQGNELERRLDDCIGATKDYVANAAMPGQLGQPGNEAKPKGRAGDGPPAGGRRRNRAAAQSEGEVEEAPTKSEGSH